jgi:uncharacterized YkwD family protein
MKFLRKWLVLLTIFCLLLTTTAQAQGFRILQRGNVGTDVMVVQGILKEIGYPVGTVDGIYGSGTANQVIAFQNKYAITPSGTVTSTTLKNLLWAYQSFKLGSSNPTPSTPAPSTPSTAGLTAEEQQMLTLVNKERTSRGLKPLAIDMAVVKVARIKAQEMVSRNYFSHTSPTYGSPFDMLRQFGVSFTAAGENLAGNQTVTAAHQALMNSTGHRANILNANYTHIGIGIVSGSQYGKIFVQMFIKK